MSTSIIYRLKTRNQYGIQSLNLSSKKSYGENAIIPV